MVGYLEKIDLAQTYSNFGPLSRELESRVAKLLNVCPSKVVSSANATLALIGTFITAPTNQWIVSNWTFPATAQAIKHSKGELHLCDISMETWLPEIQSRVGNRFGLVVTVPFGARVPLEEFTELPTVVFDAAASLGNFDDLAQLGQGNAVVFSLHATKMLGAGEGGVSVFGSKEWADAFRRWSNFGFSGSRSADIEGMNAKMSEYSAAVGLASLDRWPTQQSRYAELRKRTLSIVDSTNGIVVPSWQRHSVSPYWIVLSDSHESRDRLAMTFADMKISTRQWWPELVTEYASDFCSRPSAGTPSCETLRDRSIGLPFHLSLSEPDLQRIQLALRLSS